MSIFNTNPMIKCAAVKVNNVNELSSGYVGTGYSHTDCYDYIRDAYGIYANCNPEGYVVTEGFMLDNDTFISREDALELIHYTGQLKPEYKGKEIYRLYSYMIDYSYLSEVAK